MMILLYFVYKYFKKRIIKLYTILISNDSFKLNGKLIPFKTILSYKITHFGGASIKIYFKDNSKLKLTTILNLSTNQNFNDFCLELEAKLSEFSFRNSLTPRRIKGFYEKKINWAFFSS